MMKVKMTPIDYQILLDDAMLGIVRKALLHAQNYGFIDDQCFYISFKQNAPDVMLSERVRNLYPDEITIVLQYQFKDLDVSYKKFSVNISFNGISETIEIPFYAITSFVDPSAKFSLQFTQGNKNDYNPLYELDTNSEIELAQHLENAQNNSNSNSQTKTIGKSASTKQKNAKNTKSQNSKVVNLADFKKKKQ